MTASSGNNNIKNKQGEKYDTEMVQFFLLLFHDTVLMLLLFADAVSKLSSLTQGLVNIFSKVTVMLGDSKIKNEWGSKYYIAMVPLFMLLF